MLPASADGNPDYSSGVSPYGSPYGTPYGVATPVPAPIPVQVYEAAWYFRGDIAAGFGANPSVTMSGNPYSTSLGGVPFGLDPTVFSGSFEPSFVGTVGVGYIWGPFVRTDLTVDIHSIMDAKFTGAATYNDGLANQTWNVSDKSTLMSTIFMLNGYYDIRTGTAFTPYVGGGLGFAVNQLSREVALGDSGVVPSTAFFSNRSTQVQFAGAAMVGFYYDFDSFTAIDVNYRFLAFGGPDVDLLINNSTTGLSIGNIYEHQIRVGLRFYIN
jgi:opacity protein-like surface antigen